LYQGKELQDDLGLDVFDFEARMYDPAIGRTFQLDPHADSYFALSPYSWVGNNPINVIDPTGMDTVRVNNLDMQNFNPDDDVVMLDEVSVSADRESDTAEAQVTSNETSQERTSAFVMALPIAGGAAVADGPIPIGDAIGVVILGGALIHDILYGPPVVVPVHNPGATIYNYTPPPKALPGFPGAARAKPKGGRTRWKTPNGDILEWDSQHGDVEVYNKRGRHQGSADPNTGEMIKDPVPGRTIEP
jgi:RHS repeat-associated protein